MKSQIDIDALLTVIPGDNPAGEDLRYTSTYDDIKEARRADDQLERGDWQRDLKTSDWDKVISIACKALSEKSKDLQIASWLTEGLIQQDGFAGLAAGLRLINGLLSQFWDHLYPEIDDDDLDYRIGPLQFLNDKLKFYVRQVSLTDPALTTGFSWLKWQESRQVGYEKDLENQYGDLDENKKAKRDEQLQDGKLTGEEFDNGVARSSRAFYEAINKDLEATREELVRMEELTNEKFGVDGPGFTDFNAALSDCEQLVLRIMKDKQMSEPEPVSEAEGPEEEAPAQSDASDEDDANLSGTEPEGEQSETVPVFSKSVLTDFAGQEKAAWDAATKMLKAAGIKDALRLLFNASCSAPSVRERNRYRLLMAKLCLKAERLDLARPILEELNTLIEELQLERWESPTWIGEVLDALYQCLTTGDESNQDPDRGRELLRKLCTTDVTKAMPYRD